MIFSRPKVVSETPMSEFLMHSIFQKPLAAAIFLLGFAFICLPSALFVYVIAWLLSFAFSISFDAWQTHAIVWGLAFVWTLYAISTDEGDQLLAKVITLKR